MASQEKVKALAHYICKKCSNSSRLGAIKLNKVFWFADRFAYQQTGESITGCRYKKLKNGPVPVEVKPALTALEGEGKIAISESEYFNYKKTDYVSLKDPDTSLFNEEELKFIDEIIEFVCDGHTAKSISDLSHDLVWEAAGMGEEIPMYAVLAGNPAPITTDDMMWADEVLERVNG